MLLYQQTPVGEKIKLGRSGFDEKLLRSIFKPYTVNFYDSGTSALAIAIATSIKINNSRNAEVIIPAYSCPDLISAILYAGAKPVLVDFIKDRPWMDLDQIKEKITSQTVAIIAVNFLGIPERIEEIKKITDKSGITLIEDNAQFFPDTGNGLQCSGDMVVLSFGRGKPVNMLTGGAVLFHDKKITNLWPELKDTATKDLSSILKYYLKSSIYNLTISPYLYGYLEKLPFLHIGETRYKDLAGIERLNTAVMLFLYDNIKSFQVRKRDIQKKYAEILSTADNDRLINLPGQCFDKNTLSMLRYPVLCSDLQYRDELYLALKNKGIGVSRMYKNIIPELTGIKGSSFIHEKRIFMNARVFADSLITFPTHSRTTDSDLKNIRTILTAI